MIRCRVRRLPNAPGWWLLRDAVGDIHVYRIVMKGQTPIVAGDSNDDVVEPNKLHDWFGPLPGVPVEWGKTSSNEEDDLTW